MSESGMGCAQSYGRALKFFKMAASQGDPGARGEIQKVSRMCKMRCPLLGKRVILRGLVAEASRGKSGRAGKAVDFGHTQSNPDGTWYGPSGRYTVKLDGEEGQYVKVKDFNVEPERA